MKSFAIINLSVVLLIMLTNLPVKTYATTGDGWIQTENKIIHICPDGTKKECKYQSCPTGSQNSCILTNCSYVCNPID